MLYLSSPAPPTPQHSQYLSTEEKNVYMYSIHVIVATDRRQINVHVYCTGGIVIEDRTELELEGTRRRKTPAGIEYGTTFCR